MNPQPDYHPQKPLIVGLDDRLESPETIALKYEEAARGVNTRGDSPIEMAAYGKAAQLPPVHGKQYPALLRDGKRGIKRRARVRELSS